MKRLALLLLLPLPLWTMGTSCETDIIDDPGFQLWCGDSLCDWTTKEGSIEQVPTWHERDYAVSLVGEKVVLVQTFQRATPSCVRIELIADVEPEVEVFIELTHLPGVDWKRTIEGQGFKSLAWDVDTYYSDGTDDYDRYDPYYSRPLVRLTKIGQGYAAIAQLRVSDECGYP